MPTTRENAVVHITFSVEKLSKDKKHREQKKEEVVNAICALLNSNGGTVEIRGEETEGNLVSTKILDSLTRTLEQSSQSRFGTQGTIICDKKEEKMIITTVGEAPFLVTIKYNLYRPTQKQVEVINNVQNAFEIMNERFIAQPVQFGSHQKTFFMNRNCCFVENENTQFKHLKSDSSKRVTLADRMIGKSNKFSCYVSAFANHRGGHIYYGIDDDGVVHGENTENISEIDKKVEKSIQKMIWPDMIGQPKRGEHWEIFFQPVLDEKSNLIPSTFVIVIFIAPCFGGVFTEQPESYEMVEGKVERMSFTTWKKKLQPVGRNKRKQEIPSTTESVSLCPASKRSCLEPQEVPSAIKRISLGPRANERCIKVNERLTKAMNNANWKEFEILVRYFKQRYPHMHEVKLIVFLRRLMATYRQAGNEASNLFSEYRYLSRAGEPFESFYRFSKKVVARVSGKAATESQDISTAALAIAEMMEHGLLTAAVLLIAALVYDSQNDEGPSPEKLCLMALEHLEYAEDATLARPDMIHTAHIILATYHMGYYLPGKLIKKNIDNGSLERAKNSLMKVRQSVYDGNQLMPYRKIWFKLAESMLYMRHSQFEPENESKHLTAALDYANKAENPARDLGLKEIVSWVQKMRLFSLP